MRSLPSVSCHHKGNRISQQLQRIAHAIPTLMQSVNPCLMATVSKLSKCEVITVPFILRPAGVANVRPRQVGDLSSHETTVNKELNLNSSPWVGVVNCPPNNRSGPFWHFSPTVQNRWEGFCVKGYSDCSDQDRLENGFTNQYMEQLR